MDFITSGDITRLEVLQPTMNLRWLRKEDVILGIVDPVSTKVLQQAWMGNQGTVEWRDVEVVNERNT